MLKTQKSPTRWSSAEIGQAAGQIWSCLNGGGKLALGEVSRKVDMTEALLNMGIGWLAREGKLELGQEGRSVKVWLTE